MGGSDIVGFGQPTIPDRPDKPNNSLLMLVECFSILCDEILTRIPVRIAALPAPGIRAHRIESTLRPPTQ
jgi:hypothetical protein